MLKSGVPILEALTESSENGSNPYLSFVILDIKSAVSAMKVPHLHVHGNSDSTVLINEAHNIKNWNLETHLHIIKGANHVFDSCHPYDLTIFPRDLKDAIDTTIGFLKG